MNSLGIIMFNRCMFLGSHVINIFTNSVDNFMIIIPRHPKLASTSQSWIHVNGGDNFRFQYLW